MIIVLVGQSGSGKSTVGHILESHSRARVVRRVTTREPRLDDRKNRVYQSSAEEIRHFRGCHLQGWQSDCYCIPASAVEQELRYGLVPVVEMGMIADALSLKQSFNNVKIVSVERELNESELRALLMARGMSDSNINARIASIEADRIENMKLQNCIDFSITNVGNLDALTNSVRRAAVELGIDSFELTQSSYQSFSFIEQTTWIHPDIVVAQSGIQGQGVFATKLIRSGEIITRWGGEVMSQEEFLAGRGLKHSNVGIDEGMVLAQGKDSALGVDDYMNHSCDPNVWLIDEVTLVSRRQILPGEELTIDYATELGDQSYLMARKCNCGARLCRGRVAGTDWRIESLWTQYGVHFSPFILRRIEFLQAKALNYWGQQ